MNHELLQQRFDAANSTDEAFLEGYNAATVEVWKKPLMGIVLNYVLTTGVWEKLESASINGVYPEELRQKIRKFLTTITSGTIPDLRVKDAEPEQNLPILTGAGIITQDDADGFLNLAREYASQSFIDHGRETTQVDLNVMRNQAAIAATQQIISDAETLDSTLTAAEFARQSARANELAALRLVLSELEEGIERETPTAPSGEAWE